ncbi:Glo2p [Malassezia vespertilionis]|uniref:hydroxyacylglutathione hydrolase n=1 Tax=Malassezia vespertilionis TaxID=2020962 RepID=A0A2N1JFH2_9BASI|nr:Glo2p [Malassezia vespertilionis]
MSIVTHSNPEAFPSVLRQKRQLVSNALDENAAMATEQTTIKEKCPGCGNEEMNYHTLQLRIPVRDDNYAYIMMSTPTKSGVRPEAVFVDPYDVPKVRAAAHELGLKDSDIVGLLTTHKHFDHAGGNKNFMQQYPNLPSYGSSSDIPTVSHVLHDGESTTLFENSAAIRLSAYATPCHTRDSTCFLAEDMRSEEELARTPAGVQQGSKGDKKRGVFTGDTLFISGCGRFFEGTPAEMNRALNVVLAGLPQDALVYCGHEYTASNAKFSNTVLPERPAILSLLEDLASKRNNGVTTGLYTLAEEREHNPFMLVNDPHVQRITGSQDPVEVLRILREAKNQGFLPSSI